MPRVRGLRPLRARLPLCRLVGANHAPNGPAEPTPHSYRRISTGSSLDAARAGRIVAANEIPMRNCRNPDPIHQSRMKWHVRNRIHLRIQRNQMIGSRDKRQRISNDQPSNVPTAPMMIPCHKKICRICLRRVPMRHQHGDVARFVGHRHRKHYKNVQPGHKCNQPDKNRGHQFFHPQGAEQSARFSSIQVAAAKPGPAVLQNLLQLRHALPQDCRAEIPAHSPGRLRRKDSARRVNVRKHQFWS